MMIATLPVVELRGAIPFGIAQGFPFGWAFTASFVGKNMLLLPVVVGISYEINRWCGRHDNWLSKGLSAPGKWLQRLTTNEPDDSMIECAIRAMELVIPEEKGADAW